MAKKPLNALDEQALAVSALSLSIAQTIGESDKKFPEKLAKKLWEQMSDSEKVEELYRLLGELKADVQKLDRHSDALQDGISEMAERLEALERRVCRLEGGAK